MNKPHTPTRLRDTKVTLAHGGGGKAMRDLIEDVFTSVFVPDAMEDQARLTGSIEPLLAALRTAERRAQRSGDPRLAPVAVAAARDMERDFAQLAAVVQGPFLTGQTMTITDVYAAMLADWYDPAKQLPELAALVSRVLENPAVAEAWRNHGFGG